MSTRTTKWPAGMPCWADLATPDVAQAKAFYGAVLGWEYEDQGEEYGNYVLAQRSGLTAAGLAPAQEGMPHVWMLYVASDDADATAAKITEQGGMIFAEPFDVGPLGRMLVAADPTGGAFGVWQAGEHIGASVVNEPGALSWDDLQSTDPDAARAFYTAVFGYRTEPMPQTGETAEAGEGGEDYQLVHLPGDDAPIGGIGGMFGAPEGTPSHWTAYFGVADVDAAVAAATANGGTVVVPAFETPYGRMAGLADPAEAMFFVAQTDGADQPDRSV